MRQRYLLVLTLLASLLAACAALPSAPAAPPAAKSVSAAPSPANAAAPAAPGEPIIQIERSGGIAGKTEKTMVYASGEMTTNEATTAQMGPSAAQTLLANLDAAGFFALKDSYRSRCNDCFQVRITVTSATQTKTVTYIEDGNLPDELNKVINVLATMKPS